MGLLVSPCCQGQSEVTGDSAGAVRAGETESGGESADSRGREEGTAGSYYEIQGTGAHFSTGPT